MKKFFFVMMFSSSAVFACPQMTGTYSCTGGAEPYSMDIAQSEENGVTTYSLTIAGSVQDYIADSVARPVSITIEGNEVPGTLATSCAENGVGTQLLTNYQGTDVEVRDGFTISEDGSLVEVITIMTNGEPYSTETYNCTKNN